MAGAVAEGVVERRECVVEAVARAGVEPRVAPEVELLPAVTVVPNPVTQTQLVSVSVGVASVPNSRRKRHDTIWSSDSRLLQEPGPELGCESHKTCGLAWE